MYSDSLNVSLASLNVYSTSLNVYLASLNAHAASLDVYSVSMDSNSTCLNVYLASFNVFQPWLRCLQCHQIHITSDSVISVFYPVVFGTICNGSTSNAYTLKHHRTIHLSLQKYCTQNLKGN